MATDMFGNILSPEEEERLRLHQIRMGIEPAPMDTPSLYPNQAAPYGSFPYVDPTTPSIWESPLGVVPSAPQLAGPTVNKFKPTGSDYTPQQLSTPIEDLQQQNIPSNVVPITGGLAATDSTGGFMQNVLNAIIPTAEARLLSNPREVFATETPSVTTNVVPQVPMYSDDTWDATNPFNRDFIERMYADEDAAQNVDTFVDMPQETQATTWDMAKTVAKAIARNAVGKLGIDLDPMSTGMSEEGLEKVLAAAWENQQSDPTGVALTTLQAGQLGLSKQDESAYDANIGAIPAGVVSLSPAGYTYNDPSGIQLVSAAAAADPTVTPAEMISKKTGIPFTEEQIDFLGQAIGVHPVTDFAPSTGGGGTDALYYQGYTAPAVAKPTPVSAPMAPRQDAMPVAAPVAAPAGPSAAEIARQNAVNAQMAVEMAARQRQQQQAGAAEQARQAQAAQAAQEATRRSLEKQMQNWQGRDEQDESAMAQIQAALDHIADLQGIGVTSGGGRQAGREGGRSPLGSIDVSDRGSGPF